MQRWCLAFLFVGGVVWAAEPKIDPATAAQLRRLEPLSAAKVDVFVESGSLTSAQGELVRRSIDSKGRLNLAESSIGITAAPAAPAPAAPLRNAPPARARDNSNPYAEYGYRLSESDRAKLTRWIDEFRFGDHPDIAKELRKFRPEVNELIAQAYTDPIDLDIKAKLWEKVAGPKNPDAVVGLFQTYRAAVELAKPVLVPYAKDVGGAVVRRKSGNGPAVRTYTSRELRDLIEYLEGSIARCATPAAAIYLMDVYAGRYGDGEAPMRDSSRDRHRMVEACGGDGKRFDQDEPETWGSMLSIGARAQIAEHLIEWLHRSNDDRRRIATNGLMICLAEKHPDWKAGKVAWEVWWDAHKTELKARR